MRVRGTLMLVCLVVLVFGAFGASTRAQQATDSAVPAAATAGNTSAAPAAPPAASPSPVPTTAAPTTIVVPTTTQPPAPPGATVTSPPTMTTTTTTPKAKDAVGGPTRDLPLSLTTEAEPLTPLLPQRTARSSGRVTVSSPRAWALQVSDTTPGSPAAGHLIRAGCGAGDAFLAEPLRLEAAPLGGEATSAGEQRLSGTPVALARGSAGLTRLRTVYRQIVGREDLVRGCSYTAAVMFTVSPA